MKMIKLSRLQKSFSTPICSDTYIRSPMLKNVKLMLILVFLTDQLAGERGQFRCTECRREIISPDEGFPICFISEYLREHINKATTALELDKHAKSGELKSHTCMLKYCYVPLLCN